MTAFDIYLISILDGVLNVCTVFMCVSGIVIFIGFIEYTENCDTKFLKRFKKAITVFVCSVLAFVFIPSSKTALAMYAIPPVIVAAQTNQEMQKLPDNVLKFINDYLEKELNEKEK